MPREALVVRTDTAADSVSLLALCLFNCFARQVKSGEVEDKSGHAVTFFPADSLFSHPTSSPKSNDPLVNLFCAIVPVVHVCIPCVLGANLLKLSFLRHLMRSK